MASFGCGSSSAAAPPVAQTHSASDSAMIMCSYDNVDSNSLPSFERMGFVLGKTLGSGTYAKVKAAWSMEKSELIAMKILNKNVASQDYLVKFLPREISILLQLKCHPNILRCYNIIETDTKVLFVMQLAANGDLLDYVNKRRHIPEPEARCIFRQILRAMKFLHDEGIAHRDLKCENVMLGNNMEVKLGDFGFAIDMKISAAHTPCGSYSYAAPELFHSGGAMYDPRKSDSWSLGVILYAMVCGRLPFGDDSQVKRLQRNGLCFVRSISSECRNLITNMLNPSPASRYDITDMLLDVWTASSPVCVPAPIGSSPKHTIGNSLVAQQPQPQTQTQVQAQFQPQPQPQIWSQPQPQPQTWSQPQPQPQTWSQPQPQTHAWPQPQLQMSPQVVNAPHVLHHVPQVQPQVVAPDRQMHPLVARLEVYKRRLSQVVQRRSQDKGH